MEYECASVVYSHDIVRAMLIASTVIFILVSIVAIINTIVIFRCKTANERPLFVVLQTIFLNLFCVSYAIYFALELPILKKEENKAITNIVATIGDCFLTAHDWIFT